MFSLAGTPSLHWNGWSEPPRLGAALPGAEGGHWGYFLTPFPGSSGSSTPRIPPLPSLLASWSIADWGASQARRNIIKSEALSSSPLPMSPQGVGGSPFAFTALCLLLSLRWPQPLRPEGKVLPFNQDLYRGSLQRCSPS